MRACAFSLQLSDSRKKLSLELMAVTNKNTLGMLNFMLVRMWKEYMKDVLFLGLACQIFMFEISMIIFFILK